MSNESVVFQGFTVLQMKVEERSKAIHYLYVKNHNVRDANPSKPKDKTLFVLNIPPYCNKSHIEEMFSKCGAVQRVYIHSKPTAGLPPIDKSNFFPSAPIVQGYKVAYVVFKKAATVQIARSLPYEKPLIMHQKEGTPLNTGLSKWCNEYTGEAVNTNTLQAAIDTYMEEFDRKLQQEIEEAKAQEGVPDEDGWITVTKYGKNKAAPRTEAHEKVITRKEKKRRKEKELMNFYSFQLRESKREQIANLRKKFEEDKQKIQLMKATRRFRPY